MDKRPKSSNITRRRKIKPSYDNFFSINSLSHNRTTEPKSQKREKSKKKFQKYSLRETILFSRKEELKKKTSDIRKKFERAHKIINDAVNSTKRNNKKLTIFNDKSLQQKVFVIIRKQRDMIENSSKKKKQRLGERIKQRARLKGPFIMKNSECHIEKKFKKSPVKVKKLFIEGKAQKLFKILNDEKPFKRRERGKGRRFKSKSFGHNTRAQSFRHPTEDINLVKNPKKNIFYKIENDLTTIARSILSKNRPFSHYHNSSFDYTTQRKIDKFGIFGDEFKTLKSQNPLFESKNFMETQKKKDFKSKDDSFELEIDTKLSTYFEKFQQNNNKIKNDLDKKIQKNVENLTSRTLGYRNKFPLSWRRNSKTKRREMPREHVIYREARRLDFKVKKKKSRVKESIDSWFMDHVSQDDLNPQIMNKDF